MSKAPSTEKPDFIEKIADHAGHILIVSVAAIIAAWSFYFFQFRGGLSDDTAIWGQFGDFVGGTLNSIFAFFSFVILLSSLRLQLKELRLTREELEATRQELAASRSAQEMQASHFDREARKKDHSDACIVIEEILFIQGSRLKLSTNGQFGFSSFAYPGSKYFPAKNANTVTGDELLAEFINKIYLINELDHHMRKLSDIFPNSPVIIKINHERGAAIYDLIKKGWVDSNTMTFFISQEEE